MEGGPGSNGPARSSCCGGGRPRAEPTTPHAAEDAFRAWLGASPAPTPSELVVRLDESHPQYDGLDANAVVRMRGALFLALGRVPLPADALPFLLEELETADDAYLAAVTARVLRVAGDPRPEYVEPLLAGLFAIRHCDALVCPSSYGGSGSGGDTTSATKEILRTLAWLGGRGRAALPRLAALRTERTDADTLAATDEAVAAIEGAPAEGACCCHGEIAAAPAPARATPSEDVESVEFEDQDGRRLLYRDYFIGKPSIVVFFYTRCENTSKCPVTISRLGDLQRALRAKGLDRAVRTAAITYDPAFDLPIQLEQYRLRYGAERADDHRMLRTTGDFAPIRSYFELGVNYGPTTLNRHRLEAYALDASGRIVSVVTRRRWREEEILARVEALLAATA